MRSTSVNGTGFAFNVAMLKGQKAVSTFFKVLFETIIASLTNKHVVFDQRLNTLLEKEGVSLGAFDKQSP